MLNKAPRESFTTATCGELSRSDSRKPRPYKMRMAQGINAGLKFSISGNWGIFNRR